MSCNRFVIEYKPLMRRWHWTLRAANYRVMANGPQEGYASRKTCLAAVRTWAVNAYDADASDNVYEALRDGSIRHIQLRRK